jgi:hypothetical protein
MTVKHKRLFITTSDILIIEHCSRRTASDIMKDIKDFFKKTEKRHRITFNEYAEYLRIPVTDLDSYR